MLIIRTFLMCLILLSACALPSFAATDPLVGKIQKTYDSMRSFDAKYTQVLRNTSSGEEQERVGMMFFKKPQLIRLEVISPEKELFIVGKNAVWNYLQEEEVVYKEKLEAIFSSKNMIKFISGQARLDEDFWVKREKSSKSVDEALSVKLKGMIMLNLVPREPEPELVQAYVWVDPKTGLLRRVLLQDFYGNENDMFFETIKMNTKQPASLFTFTPPKGADIIDNTK